MRFLILGYGKFGQIALERIRASIPDSTAIVVDSEAKRLSGLRGNRVETVTADCVQFMVENTALIDQDVVVPMVPFNLAAKYVLAKHQGSAEIAFPTVINGLPNPLRLDSSNLCCSHADFLCPDDCPEGPRCSVTGEPRDQPLFELLQSIEVPGCSTLVLPSRQILPGVGGYTLGDLRMLESKLKPGCFLVGTSCKCHGILTAIEMKPSPPLQP